MNTAALTDQLTRILAKPAYAQLLARANSDGELVQGRWYKAREPLQFATEAVNAAFGEPSRPKLREPIQVTELRASSGSLELYRVYDGISRRTALTLGRWWCSRHTLKRVCNKISKAHTQDPKDFILKTLLRTMFVHPSWNKGTDIARMVIPQGASAPVIIGEGCWEALGGTAGFENEEQVQEWISGAIPGSAQIFVPLVHDMWVRKVPKLSENWPFA